MFGLDGCGVELPGSEQPLHICTQEISRLLYASTYCRQYIEYKGH